jgi:hypothetical protein
MLYRVHLPWTRFELTTLVVIGTDCIGYCKSNYHTITTAITTMISRLQHTNFNTQIKMVNFISCLAVVIKLVYKNITTLNTLILLFYLVFFHWYDEISCFVASHWQTWSHIDNILPWTRFGLTTLVVIGTDYTGSCKSNYHMITTETSPMNFKETAICKLEWIY